uniref:ARID domain-containing protein n=1 Tax=Tetranychus urticae TaxID=32264 RepID=T1KRQ2_TETUR
MNTNVQLLFRQFTILDLFYLFTLTQKLGGYERITKQRIWKIVYDRLGGDPRSTSAATCTRRHFERLLLPFERHLNEARGIKTNRRSTRGRSISPLGSPELSTKGGEGLDDDQSIASATSMVTEERKGRRGHHRHRHRRQGVRQSKRLQQGSSSSAPATVAAASTNGSTSSATDDDESESLNSELHEEEASKSSIVDGCSVEAELVKSEESQSGQSERKIDKDSNNCSDDELSSRNGLPNQSRDESQVECKDENERKSLTCPVKSTASPSVEDNLNCSQSERKPTSQMSAVGVEENMEIDKVSNFETTDDVKPGSSMVNLDGADEVKNDANKDLNETKVDKIELKSVNSELDGDDMKPIKSEVESKSADEISADEKRDKNLTTGTDDCDTDDNVEVDLNLSKSDKLSTANGAVNVDTNNAASPLSSISTLISAMDAAKQQQQVHLTREMKVESNESETIPPVNGIKKANLNVKSNSVAATVNATVNNSLNVSLNSNVTNTTSGRPSVIHKTPLKPCVKVVPTYKDNPIDGLPKDNSLLKKPCLPPIAHAATFLPSPWYTQQIPFTSGSSSTSSSVTKSTKLTPNFTSSSLKRKVAPSSHQDSLLLPLDLTVSKKRIVEVDRKVVTPKDKVTSEDTSPSTILDLSAKVRVKECKSGKNSGLQVIHNSMDSNNNINNNTNNSIHRSAHQHAANNNAVINSVPKRTTLKSNSSKAAVNHQTQNQQQQQQQQQQRHVNPSPLPVSSPVAITGTTSTPKHHSSSQSNHKTISNSNRSQLIKSSPSPNALKMKDKSNHSASSVTNSGSGLKDLNQQQQHLIQTHLNAQQQHQQLPLLPPGFPFSPSELSAANRDVQSKLQSSNTLNQLRAMVTPENFALASQTIAQEIAFREMERLHPNLAKQMSSAAAVLGYPAGFHPMLNSVHRPTVPSSPSISEYNPTLPSFLPFFNSFPTAAAAGSGTQTNSNGNGSGPNMNMNAMAAAAAAALASGHFFNPAMLGQQGGVSGFSPLELLGDERFSAAAAAAAENDARWRGWFE